MTAATIFLPLIASAADVGVEEVKLLKEAGLAEDTIIAKIQQNSGPMDLSVDQMLELRAVGVLRGKSGSGRNAVTFNPEKVGVQAYKVVLTQLDHGECGLLAPNAMASASVSSSGKVFAFGVE